MQLLSLNDGIITMTSYWARWRLKLPASRLFTEAFIQAPMTGEYPAQRASNAEIFSIWWRHHVHIMESHKRIKPMIMDIHN